ncbi:hypothetical protein Clacol_005063 [Clathrus columnatus]|uniref:Polycomb protein VEFS-Box domain-containing protein n=1 Tax=Clathrus columnatus TaxID=1419009 RepID=A0AAV5AD45_9AGAM|nr:hypothetical protein Clacol_005063 [Clathrus columnatus]
MRPAARRHTFPRRALEEQGDDDDDDDDAEPPKLRRPLATRGAVKNAYWKLRSPHISDKNMSDDESDDATSSSSSTSTGAGVSANKPETYLIPDPVTETPPVPLVEAYENFRIHCKKAGESWPANHVSVSFGEERETVLVLYRYTDIKGVQYGFKSSHPERECPLCSLMGILPTWSTLTKHLSLHHREIEFEIMEYTDDSRPKIIIHLNEDKLERLVTTGIRVDEEELGPEPEGIKHHPTQRSEVRPSPSSLTRSPTQPSEVELEDEEDEASFQQKTSFTIPAYHNPSEPVILTGPNKTRSYRPTGPRLYDHLSSLSLNEFGPLAWFVLDKEEEIFELVDVLDEDKVMCALWARWILLNRAGVERFLDEYWPMIYKAAGWAAWRVWLLTLVSRGFLTNKEMVDLLRQYHKLREYSEAKVKA